MAKKPITRPVSRSTGYELERYEVTHLISALTQTIRTLRGHVKTLREATPNPLFSAEALQHIAKGHEESIEVLNDILARITPSTTITLTQETP